MILWGALVRASGSGAGCGDHWPLCNGEVIPTAPALSTVIEFGHRVTSAIAGLAAILLVWVAWRGTERGSPVRKAAAASLFFMVTEGAIGAALVLFEMVAYNASIGRAVWMAAHLTNTFFLLAAITLTAWWSEGYDPPRWSANRAFWTGITLVGTLILGAGGAVTALGDTLVLGGGLDPEANPVVATLLAARIFHPTMAFIVLAVLAAAVFATRGVSVRTTSLGMALIGSFVAQMAMGALNVWLQAPIWIQILHLLATDLIWIVMVVWTSELLAAPETVPETAPAIAAQA